LVRLLRGSVFDVGSTYGEVLLRTASMWPVTPDTVLLSDKDQRHPRLAELPDFFVYDEVSPDLAANH